MGSTIDTILDAKKRLLNTDIGYIAFEEPPQVTTKEFMDKVKSLTTR